jgi:hypothetical protein
MSRAVSLPNAPGGAAQGGQATSIEQSRAIAEVQAAVLVAQQCPRDMEQAIADLKQSCGVLFLAERAFWRFPRGGQQLTGMTVQIAREAARCYGNMQYGIIELSRDHRNRQSEMMAVAWDLQSNTRAQTTFIVEWKRDKGDKGGATELESLRDIYEKNANDGARRMREMIFAILPPWFTEIAKAACLETIAKGASNMPLEQQRAEAIAKYEAVGIRRAQLVAKIGLPVEQWTGADIANLRVIFLSISRGESTKEQEFPSEDTSVSTDELTRAGRRATGAGPKGPAAGVRMADAKQKQRLAILIGEGGVTGDLGRKVAVSRLAGIDHIVASTDELTAEQAATAIRDLEAWQKDGSLTDRLNEVVPPEGDPAWDDIEAQMGGQS